MKLFVSKKKYDLLNKEYLLLNDDYEKLEKAYEEKYDRVLDLEYKSEMSYFERVDLENEILSLKEENKKLNKELEKIDKKWSNEYNNLKNKTYLTIKHLVEGVVEPKEKQAEEVNKRIVELENLLFEKNKDHKMIVKSAEKELTEMILGK